MNPKHRAAGLDVFRAVALLLVLGRHMIPCPEDFSPVLHAVSEFFIRGGWVGVDLFFVLSGFLVGGLLFRERRDRGGIALGRFYLRRGFKIYPQFWLFLAFVIIWKKSVGQPVTSTQILAELFFFQNYVVGLWGTNWSLAVEEHFYLLLPALLWAVRRFSADPARPWVRLPAAVAVVAIGCLAWRVMASLEPFMVQTHLVPTHLRIDGLFCGVLLAWCAQDHRERFLTFCRQHRGKLLAGGIAALVPAFVFELPGCWYLQVPGLAVHSLAGAALICVAAGAKGCGGWLARRLASIGRHSYATYLWHFWIGHYGVGCLARLVHWTPNWAVSTLLYLGGSLAVGAVLTVFFEEPLLALRDRIAPASGRPRAPVLIPAGASALET